MKREILCLPCGGKLREALLPASTPDEHVKFVRGALKREAVCDGCAVVIESGSAADALSIWTDSIPYSAWEAEYLV